MAVLAVVALAVAALVVAAVVLPAAAVASAVAAIQAQVAALVELFCVACGGSSGTGGSLAAVEYTQREEKLTLLWAGYSTYGGSHFAWCHCHGPNQRGFPPGVGAHVSTARGS